MKYVDIAKIINTHGIKGELKVICNFYGKNYFDWKIGTDIYLNELDGNYQKLKINSIRQHQKYLLITFENFANINLVLFMKNKELAVLEKQLSHNNEISTQDLFNYVCVNNNDGTIVGTIVDLIDNSHSGLWVVKTNNQKEILVPNNSNFIIKSDDTNKTVFINFILGMLENE